MIHALLVDFTSFRNAFQVTRTECYIHILDRWSVSDSKNEKEFKIPIYY